MIVSIGLTYKYLFKDRLAKDNTMEGWAVKIVLVLIGLGIMAFAFVTLFKGRVGQRAALRGAKAGISKGLTRAKRDVLSPLSSGLGSVSDIMSKGLS